MFQSIRRQLAGRLRQATTSNQCNQMTSFSSLSGNRKHFHTMITPVARQWATRALLLCDSRKNSFLFCRNFKTNMAGEAVIPVVSAATNNSSSSSSKSLLNHQLEELFEATYQQILAEMSACHLSPLGGDTPLNEVQSWLGKVIEYNLKNGKRNRAKSLVLAYEQFSPGATLESVHLACILGWCVELLQAYFLVVDDIMDNSITRRGQLCWYRKESVGMTAINDGIMLNNCIFQLLSKNFASHPSYLKMIDLFNEITRFTAYGQCLDLISNPLNKKPDLTKYTDDRYDAIVLYKTAYYSFSLPIRLAMYLGQIDDPTVHRQAEEILLKIGHLFQAQDDYLDLYGDPKVTGKIGTDIEDGKCSWPIVQALKVARKEQAAALMAHYGSSAEESVAKIKAIYAELDIEGRFRQFEKEQFDQICALVEPIDNKVLVKDVFYGLLTMIYQRKK